MRRSSIHRIKEERPETSAPTPDTQDRDLTYYIHDRVELMHQVFSVLKAKELKAMAPYCVQHISLNDLQELCTEELLGISSKRLCAILDGADPPSDTETSSASSLERFETISLDSISSDEEILSQGSGKKKKHKQCRHKSKTKNKRKSSSEGSDNAEKSKASRAGLTVLELLELQARARAIRAQLQQEQTVDVSENKAPETVQHVSDDEVEIKEEPTEVVEISSEDEKPKIEELQKVLAQQSKNSTKITNESNKDTHTITKKINDLIITVPQTKNTRKIKLNRTPANKIVTTQINKQTNDKEIQETNIIDKTNKDLEKTQKVTKDRQKKKTKKKGKNKNKEGSDHDEITLQLSDTEKMDLLENLDRKNYDSVSSSSSEDTESSSNEEEIPKETQTTEETSNIEPLKDDEIIDNNKNATIDNQDCQNKEVVEANKERNIEIGTKLNTQSDTHSMCVESTNSIPVNEEMSFDDKNKNDDDKLEIIENTTKKIDENIQKAKINPEKSEGELSDRESSEVEASDVRPEVVCISDEESNNKKTHKKKKNKKKGKKSKKDKTKDQDFGNGADQNFYAKSETNTVNKIDTIPEIIQENCKDDNVYEILELSDESSCNGEDGTSVLSKEPTAEEIEALSAKIDEIDRENIVTDEEIKEHERIQADKEVAEPEEISWKDRYLDSKKVKNVLTTANILNAMRKKNKELKRKLEESKKEVEKIVEEIPEEIVTEKNLEEGSIEQYNTLEASTKYVDPVKENEDLPNDSKITKEMKKDAKQLLKMYKKLLKYNDMTRQKDPNKKKKKKQKKSKEDKNKTESTEAKITS
ncbi:PREDICTED: MATH and LRR domain-containing protein PFE0570w [Papilio xuthus]|uniref:MATH and LRR domain-containing protein PFE0570w n=1 Tax=Papilio xuthus TaxID=66420 RepID=A0AAJ6Z1Z5_PAPXU|nr:PREDICTED: MATH and LRR domain-containing protein PFE0570w [Papilio xuthus]